MTIKKKLVDYCKHEQPQADALPKFKKGQTAFAIMMELLIKNIVELCYSQAEKDKANLREYNNKSIRSIIITTKLYKDYLVIFDGSYRELTNSVDRSYISDQEFKSITDGTKFGIKFTEDGKSYMYYLIIQIFNDIAHTCLMLLEHSKKKSLDAQCVCSAIDIKFPKEIANNINDEISRIVKIANGNDDDADDAPDGGEGTDEEKKPKQTKTPAKKAPAKKKEVIEKEDTSANEESGVDQSDGGSISAEAVIAPVVTPVKKSPGGKKTPAAKAPVAKTVEVEADATEQSDDGEKEKEQPQVKMPIKKPPPKKGGATKATEGSVTPARKTSAK